MVRVAGYRGSARQGRHLRRRGIPIDLGRRGMQKATAGEARRAARALSSGSASFRATGVSSEEPTVEGTRGDSIGVVVSQWRYFAQVVLQLCFRACRIDDPSARAAAASKCTQSEARGPTADNL